MILRLLRVRNGRRKGYIRSCGGVCRIYHVSDSSERGGGCRHLWGFSARWTRGEGEGAFKRSWVSEQKGGEGVARGKFLADNRLLRYYSEGVSPRSQCHQYQYYHRK